MTYTCQGVTAAGGVGAAGGGDAFDAKAAVPIEQPGRQKKAAKTAARRAATANRTTFAIASVSLKEAGTPAPG